jgi:hypothetical protein
MAGSLDAQPNQGVSVNWKPSEQLSLQHEFQSHLASVAKIVAAQGELSPHTAPVATREALGDVGIFIPPSNSKDIKGIPKTDEIPRGSKLQPGDIVVAGAAPGMPNGDSFIVTNDGMAANWKLKPIPNLNALPEVHIYRPNGT